MNAPSTLQQFAAFGIQAEVVTRVVPEDEIQMCSMHYEQVGFGADFVNQFDR